MNEKKKKIISYIAPIAMPIRHMNFCLVICIIWTYCAEFIYKKTEKHICNRKMISYLVIYEYTQVLLYTYKHI
jgi:hypothetical protein